MFHTAKRLLTSTLFSPDVQCDVCRTNLPDGSSMFCVWMSRAGQQGTLLQTDDSLHNQSGASLGEVSGSKDLWCCVSIMTHNISLSKLKKKKVLLSTHSFLPVADW